MAYANMKKIYDGTHPALYSMAVAHLLDIGFRATKAITDEEIAEIKGNPMMTQDFVQDLVRTARDIANECGNNVVELIQFCQKEKVFDTKYYKA